MCTKSAASQVPLRRRAIFLAGASVGRALALENSNAFQQNPQQQVPSESAAAVEKRNRRTPEAG
jgi:hypothetical protein